MGALRLALVQSMRDEARVVVLWTAGIVVIAVVAVLVSGPLIASGSTAGLTHWLSAPVRAFLGIERLATPAQLVDALMFGFVAPIGLLTFAIGVGSRAVARGEERTTRHGSPAPTISRLEVVPVKMAALALGACVIAAGAWAGVMVGGFLAHQSLAPGNVAAGVGADLLLGVGMGALAMLVGAATGRRALAGWAATAFVVGADAANSTGAAIPNVAGVRYLSVVYYAAGGEPAVHGVTVAHLLVLLLVAIAFTVAGGVAMQRRGLAAGQ